MLNPDRNLDILLVCERRLTVALSKTLMEFSSATFLFLRASSRVQSGSVSHFPKTTRSMSLDRDGPGYNQLLPALNQDKKAASHF